MNQAQTELQQQLISPLLEGADSGHYIVIDPSSLTTQVEIAMRETLDRNGKAQPGRAAARLVRNLQVLGFISAVNR